MVLDIETDFFDASTGLHSEGVWHNCLFDLTSLGLKDNVSALAIWSLLCRKLPQASGKI